MKIVPRWSDSPFAKAILWVLFAIVFYNSGLTFTTWLLSPEDFSGGWDWFWLLLFPALVPAFFLVNRRLGCVGGTCNRGQGSVKQQEAERQDRVSERMPGM